MTNLKCDLQTPEGKTFTFNIPDVSRPDSRGFYRTTTKIFKDANDHIDFDYLAHDLKHRGLNADNSYYERNGVRLPSVKYHAQLLREPKTVKSDDWQETAHKWCVTINDQSFDYHTGLAHRYANPLSAHDREEYNRLRHANINDYGLEKLLSASKAKPPSLEDVLYSLIMDGDACEMSFEHWCSMLGYDEDSIKALETYRACQKNTNKLQKAGVTLDDNLTKYFEDF